MFDAIYDSGFVPIIREKYPNALIKDASDCIHDSRISVEIDIDKEK
jgi:hypothetical protein